VLTEEKLGYELRVEENGHERTGVIKVGTHDDLVKVLRIALLNDGPQLHVSQLW
jgi:hypothetical protein